MSLSAGLAFAGIATAQLQLPQHLRLSALTLDIVLGILIGNTVFPRLAVYAAAGVDFSKSTLLKAGIILYGLRVTFTQLAGVGWAGACIDALIVFLTLLLAVGLGSRVFRLDRQTALLIGAGSAICGAAAVLATEPVLRAQPHKVSIAVATVVLFGTLGMFAYPALYPHLGLSEYAYGVYVGSTVHEVAQVVAAGGSVGDTAAGSAVVEKMLRVMMLAPYLLLLSWVQRRRRAKSGWHGHVHGARVFPWFSLLFILACTINSCHVLPSVWVNRLVRLDDLVLGMAMTALGLRTHVGDVRRAGAQPLLLALSLFVFLSVGGYAVNRLLSRWLG